MWQSDSQVTGKPDYVAHRRKDENSTTHRNLKAIPSPVGEIRMTHHSA
jgi:hypothetical protein